MKIIDTFIFNNEIEMLIYRLTLLYVVVDYFVIVEGSNTHSGKPKKLNFNIQNFIKFKKKIRYLVVNNIPVKTDSPKKNWHENHSREHFHRNYISNGILDANPNDLIIVSDVDEIPNLDSINFNKINDKILLFKQNTYAYKLNLEIPNSIGSAACLKKNFINAQSLRNVRNKYNKKRSILWKIKNYLKGDRVNIIDKGGWHFTYLKSPEEIKYKIENFSHGELNQPSFTDILYIKKKMINSEHLFDVNIKCNKSVIDSSYPEYIEKNQQLFKNWILK